MNRWACASGAGTEQSSHRMRGGRIAADDRLAYHPDLDPTDVDVSVTNGVVTLSGVVEDRGAKRLAEDVADDVMGVDDVNNELKVRHGLWAHITGEHVDEREVKREAEREGTLRGGAASRHEDRNERVSPTQRKEV